MPRSVGSSLGFSSLPPTMGFSLASPPPGFGFGNGSAGNPTPFKFTVLKKAIDEIPSTPPYKYELDTVDFNLALQKVDSLGKPIFGAPLETKDYILNLWIDIATNKTLPAGVANAGTCTLRNADSLAPQVAPTCLLPGQQFTVTWPQLAGSSPIVTDNWGFAISPQPGANQNTLTLTAPSPGPNNPNMIVTVTEVDALGNKSTPASSAPFGLYHSPTVSASFVPNTFTVLGSAITPMLQWVSTSAQSLTVTGPKVAASPLTPLAAGSTNVTSKVTTAPNPPYLNYTITATNVCGVITATTASVEYLASPLPTAPPASPSPSTSAIPTPSPSPSPTPSPSSSAVPTPSSSPSPTPSPSACMAPTGGAQSCDHYCIDNGYSSSSTISFCATVTNGAASCSKGSMHGDGNNIIGSSNTCSADANCTRYCCCQ
jgi:hypothetical protein